jgi:CYTH domain-containing protein
MKRKQKVEYLSKLVLVVGAVVCFLLGVLGTLVVSKMVAKGLLPTQITGGIEIERKWLLDVDNIPVDFEKEADERWEITQSYVNFSPEVRVRKLVGGEDEVFYIMTVKSDMTVDGLSREEREWYISEEEYDHLLTKSEGDTIVKTRYRVDRDGLHYEYDIFHDQLSGLAYLEIEFTSEEAARDFEQPSYVVRDVTAEKRYKNQELARYGMPED